MVFAASSLTDAFGDIGADFEAANPDVHLVFNFAGSSDLVKQVEQGAPADVVATADDQNMQKLTAASETGGQPVIFASNTMAILVESGNPTGIAQVGDLARADLIVVLCGPSVPCGAAAAAVLRAAAVTVVPRSYENRVKGVVTKVVTGEADAGIVFVTDVLSAGGAAQGVDIPTDVNVVTHYPMVRTASAAHPELADAFIEYVGGAHGQAVLASYGFGAP